VDILSFKFKKNTSITQNTNLLILDRDGVINVNIGYLHKIEDLIFTDEFPYVIDKFKVGWDVCVATNQSGIARGMYTKHDLAELSKYMEEKISLMGLDISRWYYCPHHPDFTGKCSCRKPEPGMLLQAIEDYKPKRTVFIGDKNTDLLAAEKAEIEYVDIKDVSLFTV
tara:strand:- start:1974 stop:2477 length:504 start_codon:yes stop_codon:yes gene_type:complete